MAGLVSKSSPGIARKQASQGVYPLNDAGYKYVILAFFASIERGTNGRVAGVRIGSNAPTKITNRRIGRAVGHP